MAHELAHVKHRDILIGTVAATIAGAISYLAQMAMFFGGRHDDEEGGNPIAGIIMMIVAPIAAMLIQMAISRSREYAADAGGAQLHGNPMALQVLGAIREPAPWFAPDSSPGRRRWRRESPRPGWQRRMAARLSKVR